ncbi:MULTISPECIES: DUF86 domain-containing protein [unclassified Synechococcus]|uniref:HepT-like ribonuclease domain-containing protein n=1 Tax=unclassified Synechococcus TaxID=2626047 RepID=UPI0021A401E2|nr:MULTISPECIES: HepT-like ribonuclease domain-containing protein [unclassified Synechococcus]MCT0213262.1 DUF86 domain-containing protein [Synechococcus sp. CS-1326]MCT0231925.1 DUF86 domain-containing protein [Synechococcus sp. CS-1327]
MRREALKRLLDAFEAIEAIERFIENCTLDHYLDDELIQSAVERKFEIIGEALKRALDADPSVLDVIPDLRRIVGTRNRIIHVYETVDQLILWDAIQNDLPGLKTSLQDVLSNNAPMP